MYLAAGNGYGGDVPAMWSQMKMEKVYVPVMWLKVDVQVALIVT